MEAVMNTATFINQVKVAGHNLLDALEKSDAERIKPAQVEFSTLIESAWQHFNQPEIPAREKALPRLIERWAQGDLPAQIIDPANYPVVARELRLFLGSLVIFE